MTLNADGSGNDVLIQSNGSTKAIVTAESKLGIGIGSPTADLHIHNSADHTRLNIDCSNSSGDNWQFQSRNNGEFWLRNDDNSRNDIVVYPSTGYVAAKNGLLFGADTAAANALSDYEEGTFSPSIGSGNNSRAGTWSSAIGRYTKIGNMVTLFIDITGSAMYFSSERGYQVIANLPFAAIQPTGTQNYSGSWSGNAVASSVGGSTYINNTSIYIHSANTNWNTNGVSGIGVTATYLTA